VKELLRARDVRLAKLEQPLVASVAQQPIIA
jgi:hypothetical protein